MSQQPTTTKYCTNCRFFTPDESFQTDKTKQQFGFCQKVLSNPGIPYQLVTPLVCPKDVLQMAVNVRGDEDKCGAEGKWFEARQGEEQ